MKKHFPLVYIPLIALVMGMLFSGCMSTVRTQVMRPADITLPTDIKKIVVVNRYKPQGRNAWLNVLEGIFTGEMILADRRGADNAVAGVINGLRESPRFTVVSSNQNLQGTGMGFFPEPLSAAQITSICNQYSADAVLAIEAFDSDVRVRTEPFQRKVRVNGQDVMQTFYRATENVALTMGWRLYQRTGAMIDQHTLNNQQFYTNEAQNPMMAQAGLLFPVEAVSRTAAVGGGIYAMRIAPSWVWLTREFYGRGSLGMRKARRKAQRGDWEMAAKDWNSLTRSPKQKVAKRATYNMAVAAEMMGNYNLAFEWARKAADNYNLRRANRYVNLLRIRLDEINRVNDQMRPVEQEIKDGATDPGPDVPPAEGN